VAAAFTEARFLWSVALVRAVAQAVVVRGGHPCLAMVPLWPLAPVVPPTRCVPVRLAFDAEAGFAEVVVCGAGAEAPAGTPVRLLARLEELSSAEAGPAVHAAVRFGVSLRAKGRASSVAAWVGAGEGATARGARDAAALWSLLSGGSVSEARVVVANEGGSATWASGALRRFARLPASARGEVMAGVHGALEAAECAGEGGGVQGVDPSLVPEGRALGDGFAADRLGTAEGEVWAATWVEITGRA
jgi:hypothetical protein